ncbi:MAG TPA: AraC family transcriptional regulator [Polyangiaceae bacterium]|nr:AraC family transcriptional regulator [Polyangiaceae bacterium]
MARAPDADFARLWAPERAPGVELFCGRLVRHAFSKHAHEAYTVGLNDGGGGAFWWAGAERAAAPGGLNLINPGEAHTGRAAAPEGWRLRDLYIEIAELDRVAAGLGWRGPVSFAAPTAADPPLYAACGRLFDALAEPSPRLARESLLVDVVGRLLAAHCQRPLRPRPPGREAGALARARDYLAAHFADEVGLDELARRVGLSPAYFIRAFHRRFGLPPHQYQRQLRLAHAKRALRSAAPLADVAAAHGFYDQSHLTREFRRAFGVTPGAYRRAVSS